MNESIQTAFSKMILYSIPSFSIRNQKGRDTKLDDSLMRSTQRLVARLPNGMLTKMKKELNMYLNLECQKTLK